MTKKQFDDFDKFAKLMFFNEWRFAKTMPENPHHYTLKKKWKNPKDFEWAVTFLRENGYENIYHDYKYIQIDCNGHFYWTMGAPLSETILINRKVKEYENQYDEIAEQYDGIFVDEGSHKENLAVFDIIGDCSEKSVLDIGCGTGLFLEYAKAKDYFGIDTSRRMVEILRKKHAGAKAFVTTAESFASKKYDVIVSLFGVGSYMQDGSLRKLKHFLKKTGKLYIMFFKDKYVPVTHEITGIEEPYRSFSEVPKIFNGKRHDIGELILMECKYEDLS